MSGIDWIAVVVAAVLFATALALSGCADAPPGAVLSAIVTCTLNSGACD